MNVEILNVPMAIVHVFFVPMIALLVYYKRNNKTIQFNGEFLVNYGVSTTLIVTAAKAVASIITKLTAKHLKIDSTYFGVIAIAIAFFAPYIIEILKKNIEIKCEIKGTKDENK